MATDTGLGVLGTLIPWMLFIFSLMINLSYISFEKRFPSIKELRKAAKKGKQFAFIHDPSGTVSGVCMELLPGSNQLDLDKYGAQYGIKFKPKDMNQAEYFDNRIPIYHYMAAFPHNVTVRGVTSLSRVKKLMESRGIISTPEKLTTLMSRNLDQSNSDVRKTMVLGSESRIDDKELERLRSIQRELKITKANTVGSFVFADANDFLYSVGMSAAVSLREWKSYITIVARGELPQKGIGFDTKSIGMLLIFAAIAYVIMKAGTMGDAISSVKLT
jgi:hypothetical protein